MDELVFQVEQAPEGGYTARARGAQFLPKRTTWSHFADKSAMLYVAILWKDKVPRSFGFISCGKK